MDENFKNLIHEPTTINALSDFSAFVIDKMSRGKHQSYDDEVKFLKDCFHEFMEREADDIREEAWMALEEEQEENK